MPSHSFAGTFALLFSCPSPTRLSLADRSELHCAELWLGTNQKNLFHENAHAHLFLWVPIHQSIKGDGPPIIITMFRGLCCCCCCSCQCCCCLPGVAQREWAQRVDPWSDRIGTPAHTENTAGTGVSSRLPPFRAQAFCYTVHHSLHLTATLVRGGGRGGKAMRHKSESVQVDIWPL